jgi:hypothetical protein
MKIMRLMVVTMTMLVGCSGPKGSVDDDSGAWEWDADGGSADTDGGSADTDGGSSNTDGSGDGGSGDGGSGDGGSGDSDGGSSGADTNVGYFLGMMEASTFTVFEAGVAEVGGELIEYDADEIRAECSGAVSFSIDEDDDISGEANCVSDNPVSLLQFEMSGSQRDDSVKGIFSMELNGEVLDTPFEGERVGESIELVFEHVHGEGANRFELDGSISVNLVE